MFKGELREFQKEALTMIVDKQCVLLAMVMGSGKTPTALAGIEALAAAGVVDGGLVIVPSALKYQWQREILRFTDEKPFVIDGPPLRRKFLYQYADRYRYTIIGYSAVLDDWRIVHEMQPDFIILDEATEIKGPNAKRAKRIKLLALQSDVRIALTGTPVENRAEELFSIMEFVDDDVLGDFDKFDRTFVRRKPNGTVIESINLNVLHKRMSNVMFRKTRADIADQLPAVVETVEPVEFDRAGAALYRKVAADLLKVLQRSKALGAKDFNLGALYGHAVGGHDPSAKLKGEVMSRLLCLRMLCCNPHLVVESAEKYVDTDEGSGSKYAAWMMKNGMLDKLPGAPKLEANTAWVKRILDEDEQNKIVLFSFFKGNLRHIKEATAHLTDSVIFNGDMNSRQKDKAHLEFTNNPDCRLFLSSDAGGYGVNLDMANYLRSFDLPWSYGKLAQRNSRIDRLSSLFPHITMSYTFMTGSIEERHHDMLEQKRGLAAAIVDGKYDRKHKNYEMTLKSLTEFLEESEV